MSCVGCTAQRVGGEHDALAERNGVERSRQQHTSVSAPVIIRLSGCAVLLSQPYREPVRRLRRTELPTGAEVSIHLHLLR